MFKQVTFNDFLEDPEQEGIIDLENPFESCLTCVHCKHTELFRDNTWFCNPKRQIITTHTGSWLCHNQYYERRLK